MEFMAFLAFALDIGGHATWQIIKMHPSLWRLRDISIRMVEKGRVGEHEHQISKFKNLQLIWESGIRWFYFNWPSSRSLNINTQRYPISIGLCALNSNANLISRVRRVQYSEYNAFGVLFILWYLNSNRAFLWIAVICLPWFYFSLFIIIFSANTANCSEIRSFGDSLTHRFSSNLGHRNWVSLHKCNMHGDSQPNWFEFETSIHCHQNNFHQTWRQQCYLYRCIGNISRFAAQTLELNKFTNKVAAFSFGSTLHECTPHESNYRVGCQNSRYNSSERRSIQIVDIVVVRCSLFDCIVWNLQNCLGVIRNYAQSGKTMKSKDESFIYEELTFSCCLWCCGASMNDPLIVSMEREREGGGGTEEQRKRAKERESRIAYFYSWNLIPTIRRVFHRKKYKQSFHGRKYMMDVDGMAAELWRRYLSSFQWWMHTSFTQSKHSRDFCCFVSLRYWNNINCLQLLFRQRTHIDAVKIYCSAIICMHSIC